MTFVVESGACHRRLRATDRDRTRTQLADQTNRRLQVRSMELAEVWRVRRYRFPSSGHCLRRPATAACFGHETEWSSPPMLQRHLAPYRKGSGGNGAVGSDVDRAAPCSNPGPVDVAVQDGVVVRNRTPTDMQYCDELPNCTLVTRCFRVALIEVERDRTRNPFGLNEMPNVFEIVPPPDAGCPVPQIKGVPVDRCPLSQTQTMLNLTSLSTDRIRAFRSDTAFGAESPAI